MTQKLLELNETTDDQLVIIKKLNAPKTLVYDVLTEPEHLMKWSHPHNSEVSLAEGDLKVGGKYKMVLRSREGNEYGLAGEYRELSKPDKVVYTQYLDPSYGMDNPITEITITLEENDGVTTMLFVQTGFASRQARDQSLIGWTQGFENFENYVKTL